MTKLMLAIAMACLVGAAHAQDQADPTAPAVDVANEVPFGAVHAFLRKAEATATWVGFISGTIALQKQLGKDTSAEVKKVEALRSEDADAFQAAVAAAGENAGLVSALITVRAAEIELIDHYSDATRAALGSATSTVKAQLELVE